MALEQTGIKLVVEGANQAVRALGQYDKALGVVQQSQSRLASLSGFSKGAENAVSAFRKQGAALTSTNTAFQSLNKLLPQVSSAMTAFSSATGVSVPVLGSAAGAAGGLSSAFAAIPPPALAAGAAIVAVTAGFTAFLALGSRGAALQPTITAFGNLAGQFGDSTTFLRMYREQTRGAISDIDLMRGATLALSGVSGELGSTLSQSYGQITNDVGRLAQALGLDAAEQQQKFILALKTGQRDLIDQLGLVVSADAAYRDYAKGIGVASTALTEQQRKTAFSLAVIKELGVSASKLGEQSSTLANLAVPFTILQNILDKLSLAVQPLFGPFTEGVANLFRAFEGGVNVVLPLVETFSEVLAAMGSVVFSVGELVATAVLRFTPLGFIIQSLGAVIPYVVASVQLLGEAFSSVAGTIAGAIQSVTGTLDGFGVSTGATIEQLAGDLARGGGYIIGSFAKGLLDGGAFVVTAVTKIAQIVADFLQGFSPPEKGPLSNIDKGGENVARAWADGFLGGITQSTQDAAQFVTDQLGNVASLTAKDVKERFAVLDKALQPFNEQLTISKGIFEQIAGVAEPALKVLNRQIEQAIKSKDVARLQELDKQAESLNKLKNEQQGQLDNAELQLALAKAQQAQERALLTVQQGRVKATKDIASAAGSAEKALSEAGDKVAKGAGGGGGGKATTEAGGLGTPLGGAAPDVLSNAAVDKARAVLTGGFSQGLADSGFNEALGKFNEQTGELSTQLGRIKSAKPGESIKKALDPVKQAGTDLQSSLTKVQETVNTALSTIGEAFSNILGSEGVQNILSAVTTAVDKLGTSLSTLSSAATSQLSTIGSAITDNLGLSSQAKKGTDGASESINKIGTALTGVLTPAKTALDQLSALFNDSFGEDGAIAVGLNALVADDGLFGKEGLLVTGINAVFGDKGAFAVGIPLVQGLIQDFSGFVDSQFNTIQSKLVLAGVTFTNFKTTVSTIMSDLLLEFTNFSNGIGGALSSLGQALTSHFVTPFLNAVNGVIGLVQDGLNEIIRSLPGILGIGEVTINKIKLPGAAMGGVGLRGLTMVGERGPELVNLTRPSTVFPNNVSRAIMGMSQAPPSRTLYDNSAGNTTNNNSNTSNSNTTFNVSTPEQARLLERQRRAFMGV